MQITHECDSKLHFAHSLYINRPLICIGVDYHKILLNIDSGQNGLQSSEVLLYQNEVMHLRFCLM